VFGIGFLLCGIVCDHVLDICVARTELNIMRPIDSSHFYCLYLTQSHSRQT